jgi:hypothetical protein
MVYYAQTIEQMRGNVELTAANPPAAAVMPLPGCDGKAGSCSWRTFRTTAEAKINRACVAK